MIELSYSASSSAKSNKKKFYIVIRILYFSDKVKLILVGFKHKYFHFIDRKFAVTNEE